MSLSGYRKHMHSGCLVHYLSSIHGSILHIRFVQSGTFTSRLLRAIRRPEDFSILVYHAGNYSVSVTFRIIALTNTLRMYCLTINKSRASSRLANLFLMSSSISGMLAPLVTMSGPRGLSLSFTMRSLRSVKV
ncbi:hypothetical protein IW261DRAFT_628950 [Armillaria novae-zelandiae]|uniref:Uncharacterized protein n=1 Tax=Armillaria novae-zelandiae TaxID=153914 RepID=A0AA39PQY3_9AGAR|nr:hypothetical protein IW261DRAFT_628950 [Armillaria novae-zelandiae]